MISNEKIVKVQSPPVAFPTGTRKDKVITGKFYLTHCGMFCIKEIRERLITDYFYSALSPSGRRKYAQMWIN
jgi:hypothetical protein